MFNQLFPYPRVAGRHQNGPLADARLCYLDHLAAQGAAPLTLRNTARELLVIAREMCWDGSGKVNLEQIAAAANHWATRPQHPLQHGRRTQNAEGARAFFMLIARRWIRFLGCLSESEEPVSPGYVHSADFAMYLRDERGLSPRTIQNRSWHVERLLGWIATRGLSLHQLSVMDIEEYLSQATATGWTRVSINTCAGALRSFLRHAENRRW